MSTPPAREAPPHGFRVAALEDVRHLEPIPELEEIDRAIDRPYIQEPRIYSSQAWSRRVEYPWVLENIGPLEGKTVLDVGPGYSPLPILLARRGARVVAVDPQPFPEFRAEGIRLVGAGLPRLPFRDRSFDIVTCVSVLEHLPPDLGASLQDLYRVARERVLLTFDLALDPLARLGLSRPEWVAIARSLGELTKLPSDPLVPTGIERIVCGSHVGVCLAWVQSIDGRWPPLELHAVERALVRLHRAVQRGVRLAADLQYRVLTDRYPATQSDARPGREGR